MASKFDSPVDVDADAAGLPGLAHMAIVLGTALLVLMLGNAHALAAWADGLEPSARSAQIAVFAHGVADQTAALGLDGPRAALKSRWDNAKRLRWDDQAVADAPHDIGTQLGEPISAQR
ncbi:hypothetical protein [Sandarakinorhabdus sp.]|uniref:hypothetical protein n=1 Tax=Sandarakinorhabdus sp. TaxID=1916663 RepID=UPI003341DCC0